MRDTIATLFRDGRTAPGIAIAALLLAMACGLAGCAGGVEAFAEAGNGATVAFESIDGPPPQVFDRLIGVLDSESKLRSLSIVSRESSASYRVRSYLAAQIYRGRASIAWVWDVYDRNQQRMLRLSGEEPAGKAGRDPWTAADDLVLRRIAQAGFSGLSGMVNGTAPADVAPLPSAPEQRGPAMASADQPAPASAAFGVSAFGNVSPFGGASALGGGGALGYSDR